MRDPLADSAQVRDIGVWCRLHAVECGVPALLHGWVGDGCQGAKKAGCGVCGRAGVAMVGAHGSHDVYRSGLRVVVAVPSAGGGTVGAGGRLEGTRLGAAVLRLAPRVGVR